MRRLAFMIALFGIFILLILLNFQSPTIVNSTPELSKLPDNSKVQTSGKVISERQYQTQRILKLDNSIEIICNSCPPYINRTLTTIGILERYQNRTQIQALRITAHKL